MAERHEFEVLTGDAPAPVVIDRAGRQPRPRRHGEARGCVAYRADERSLTCETYIWVGGSWQLTAERRFQRS